MSTTGGSTPPMFSDNDKFDGTNWVAWSNLIRIAAEVRGAMGYLEGTIPNPTTVPAIIITPPTTTASTTSTSLSPTSTAPITSTSTSIDTSWESPNPTEAEWKVRNAWAKGLLIFNIKNPIGLGINIAGTAAEAWKSYVEIYEAGSDLAVANAEMELRNMHYIDSDDFPSYIARIRVKWAQANALGASINDQSFKTILLNSLPRSWDPVVASLYRTSSSIETISQLNVHWLRISRDRITGTPSSTTVLQANTNARRRNQMQCTNINCGRRGHTIETCYWPGGGKEGQFPPGFGKRGGARGSAFGTRQGNARPQAAVNMSTAEPEDTETVFALMTNIPPFTDNTGLSQACTFPNTTSLSPDSTPFSSSMKRVEQAGREVGRADNEVPELDTQAMSTSANDPIYTNVTTILDSGASDHCFVSRSCFASYTPFDTPYTGCSADKDSSFEIQGKGVVNCITNVMGNPVRVAISDVLHTPNLRTNLISVSKLVAKGAQVHFEKDNAVVTSARGNIIMIGDRRDGLYITNLSTAVPLVYTSQVKRLAVPFDTWHRRLGHVSSETVKTMVRKQLVDGIQIKGVHEIGGICEDCVFGKHSARPYSDTTPVETAVLDRIHIDIWGPAPTQSAGGAKYFMLIMDGASSYRQVYFLSSKSADVTLRVFKEYLTRAERQTGRKMRRVRMDMGKEWMNSLWNDYGKEHGLIYEFTTPYAHQQNGVAERSMRTILDTARSMLAESGLPAKYWADAVQTAVYVRNFVPSSRKPDVVPAEMWSGKKQDVSHLRPFGSTAYAHIPSDLNLSKLGPRSVKVVLLGYFGRQGYKLLDRSTGSIYKSRDVIFEEGTTNLAQQPQHNIYNDENDPFKHDVPEEPRGESSSEGGEDEKEEVEVAEELITAIAPRPLAITDLHRGDGNDGGNVKAVSTARGETELPIALRRERREPRPSTRMKESLEYLQRTSAHVALTDSDVWIPRTYKEAMKRPDLWLPPMSKELEMLKVRRVYEIVPRPLDHNVVDSKWVFAPKFDENGELKDRKARVVAKGFTQVMGEDYGETYASVARLESVRLVCAIAASRGMHLWQVDFVSAFLNSENVYDVYMEPPPGFEEGGGDSVWKLLKTLYGTMQGAHDWAQNLDRTYEGHGYYKSKADSQVRSRVEGDEFTLTSTWTDDVLGASSTKAGEEKAKDELGMSYEIKDLGEARYILGMRIDYDKETGTIRLSQHAYAERMLERFNMQDAKPRSTPLPAGITLSASDSPTNPEESKDMKKIPYREALGSLMWLQVATRPDLSFTVNLLSRFANNPGMAHWNALKHAMAYVKGTLNYGITYSRNASLQPYGFVDADFAGDSDTRRSTEGHVFFAGGGPISWASKRQETVALSTVEAEYMALTRATQQALWMRKFLNEVGLPPEQTVKIYGDNNGALATTKNDKNHRRTKHIDVKYHFVKERVAANDVSFDYVPSSQNLADILTKPLARDATMRCVDGMGLQGE